MQDPMAAPHGGESVAQLVQRVEQWLDAIGQSSGRVVAVTHAAVIRAAAIVVLDANPRSFWRIDVAPLGFSTFQAHAGRWNIRALNVTR
jgi:broad specificity phosphatase PhoE